MKATLRIATKDAFCFIEAECEGTSQEIVDQYGELYLEYHGRHKTGSGITDKEMDTFVQNVLEGGTNHIDLHEKMNEEQQKTYQIIKRAIKRINYKLKKEQ